MKTTDLDKIVCFAIGGVVTSIAMGIAFVASSHNASVRGPVGGIRIMAAFFGGGVAAWFALRTRDLRLVVTAALAGLPLIFWFWVIWRIINSKP